MNTTAISRNPDLENPSRPAGSPMGEREFVAMMAMVMALQALAIDSMLPALADMARDLGMRNANQRQLVVGSFLVAAGIGALIPGPLADRWGRRPVLLGSIGCYVVFALGCALAGSFPVMIGMRVTCALTSAGLAVLPSAIARDRFSGDRMARMLSSISVVFMLVPMLAPSVGLMVLGFAGWRWIFVVLAVLGSAVGLWVALRLAESGEHDAMAGTGSVWRFVGDMVRITMHRQASGYVLGNTLVIAALFGYVNSAEQLVAEHFGAGPWFPLMFGLTAFGLAIANLFNAQIVERFGARCVSHGALLLFIATGAGQLAMAFSPHESLLGFMPLMALNIGLLGFMGANFGSLALLPFAHEAGAASSVQAFIRTGVGAVLGIAIGQSFDGTARPLAAAFLMAGCGALVLVLRSERGRLFGPREPFTALDTGMH